MEEDDLHTHCMYSTDVPHTCNLLVKEPYSHLRCTQSFGLTIHFLLGWTVISTGIFGIDPIISKLLTATGP